MRHCCPVVLSACLNKVNAHAGVDGRRGSGSGQLRRVTKGDHRLFVCVTAAPNIRHPTLTTASCYAQRPPTRKPQRPVVQPRGIRRKKQPPRHSEQKSNLFTCRSERGLTRSGPSGAAALPPPRSPHRRSKCGHARSCAALSVLRGRV